MVRRALPLIAFLAAAAAAAPQGPGSDSQAAQQPPRDTSAQLTTPTGRITGRVVAADTGRPIKRARVLVSSDLPGGLPGGRAALTDENGVFDIPELPAGRYTVSVSKTGFLSLSYGQRRPLQAGTPLRLGEGQQLKDVDFQLPRGSVVSGRIFDEDGEPIPGVPVSVMRYQYLQGDRRLVAARVAQTDDKGQYRVWGLIPGEYYVSATARTFNFAGFDPFGGRGGPGGGRRGGAGDVETALAYAPTYYPGVDSVTQAKAIVVGLSQEVADVSFGLLLVRTSRVSGRVSNPDGSPSPSGIVQLLPEASTVRGQIGTPYGGRVGWDGEFTFGNVPPGRYVLQARGDDTGVTQFASVPLTVGGGDLTDLTVILQPGATITGTVAFPAGSQPPDVTHIRMAAPSLDQGIGGPGQSRVEKDGTFSIDGVAPGPHLIRPQNQIVGWVLKSVTVGGRDITDTPVDLRSGQKLTNVVVTFTDRISQLSGTVTNAQGTPMTEFTVLAFPTDTSLWRPQARHIMTARPDQTGKYTIRGLPPGSYYVAVVDPTEQGEWFEPAYLEQQRPAASHVTLGEGYTQTLDLHVR